MATRTIKRQTDEYSVRRTDEYDRWRTDDFEARPTPSKSGPMEPSEVSRSERPLPDDLIGRYVRISLEKAKTEVLEDGSGWYAEVSQLQGVWAEGETEAEALAELGSTIRAWVILKMKQRHRDIPPMGDVYLSLG